MSLSHSYTIAVRRPKAERPTARPVDPAMQISTRTHGVIDLASAAALAAAPRVMGWHGPARTMMDTAAAGSVAYSLGTDYELGAVPVLTMRQHLAIDAGQGVAFLAAAALMHHVPHEARLFMAGFGLFSLAVGALTERERRMTYSMLARDEERHGYLMGEGV